MLKRPWPPTSTSSCPVPPAPDCINPSYGAFDPDAGRHRRRALSPFAVAMLMAIAFVFLTIGLRPTVGAFVGIAEAISAAL